MATSGGNIMREWRSLSHVKWKCKYHVTCLLDVFEVRDAFSNPSALY